MLKKQMLKNLKNRKSHIHLLFVLLIVNMMIIPTVIIPLSNRDSYFTLNDSNNIITPISSDVAGTELYGEQISAYVAGDASIIRQSLVTNDSNIFQHLDFNDPGFKDCSLMISASNGIKPKMAPQIISETDLSSKNLFLYHSFFGFLYYDNDKVSNITLNERANRAIDIIQETFEIEIILLDVNSSDFYPFVAYYPNWDILLDTITLNAPQDGYWGALDVERLKSDNYIENNYLNTVILMLDSINLLSNGLDLTEQVFDFNLKDFNFSFLDAEYISDIFSTLFGLMGTGDDTSSLLGSFDIGTFLTGGERILTTLIQYEGVDDSIEDLGNGEYIFDLFKAINYNPVISGPLKPSEKIFISLLGALLTEIDISFYSADIKSLESDNYKISSTIIDTIELLVFLLGQDIDISMIKDYSLGGSFQNDDCENELVTNIQNLNNPQDVINLIALLGFGAVPYIPTGILDPIDNLIINYVINKSEPVLTIEKNFNMLDLNTGEYNIEIEVRNEGNISAYGKELGEGILNISDLIPIPIGVEAMINILNPDISTEEYLGLDKNPRFFFIDTFGAGITDKTYPNLLNLGELSYIQDQTDIFSLIDLENANLYSPQLVDDIIDFGLFGATEADRAFYTDLFANPDSIMNPDNWKLDPGMSFSYTLDESLFSDYEFEDFYVFDLSRNGQLDPYVSYGESIDSSTADKAMNFDGDYWNLKSEMVGENSYMQIYFSFKNDSQIFSQSSSLEINRLLFQSNFKTNISGTDIFDDVILEFYNFSIGPYGDFQEVNNQYFDMTNTTLEYQGLNNLSDYFDGGDDYHSIFKLTITKDSPFEVYFDSNNVTIGDRNLTLIEANPAILSYSSIYGLNTYYVESDNYVAVTDYAPVIKATSDLQYFSSYPSQLNTYYLDISNIGTKRARNVNITIQIPGKIKDAGDFTLNNGILNYYIANINQATNLPTLSFEFYTPNSIFIPKAKIEYDNNNILNETNPDYTIFSKDLFLSAPLDYKDNLIPYVDEIELLFSSNYSDSHIKGGMAPTNGSIIELNISVTNVGRANISDITINPSNFIKGFNRTDSNDLTIPNLNAGNTKIVTLLINKTEYDAYFFHGICCIQSNQKKIIQMDPITPLILGYRDLELTKTFSDMDIDHGTVVTVTINITNTGNMDLKNITVNDIRGFTARAFSLESGIIDKVIECLKPGQSYEYSYELKANKQGIYNSSGAKISFFYLNKQISESNTLIIKVRNDWIINAAYILIPSVLGIAATLLLYWWKNRYDMENAIFQRRELLMFGVDFRASSWDKFIIDEHLQDLMDNKEITIERKREEVL